jgi:hypothetical protein
MASDLTATETTEPVEAPEASDVTKPDVSPVDRPMLPELKPTARRHQRRFFVIYGVLGLALAASIVGLVVYAGRTINPGPAWSSWKPSGGGLGAVNQIAAHIAPGYRLPDGHQLVDVIVRSSAVTSGGQTIPIPLIAVRGPKGKVDQVSQVGSSDTFMLSMCGLGQSCSIATGKPSVQRGTLVRREILEMALYTFKYVPGAKRIVAFMPPSPGSTSAFVVYLQKDDLKPQLKVPLTQTVTPKVPLPNQITARDQSRIDALTESKIYKFGLSQTQQGDAVLVLDPATA